MDIRINKRLSIIIATLLTLIYVLGLPIMYEIIHIIKPYFGFKLPLISLLIANLSFTIQNLNELIIGIWLFFNADKFKQDKWTWVPIGLVYGQYSLILIAMIAIVRNVNTQFDLFKLIKSVLVILIITFFLKIGANPLLTPYLTYTIEAKDYAFVTIYSAYLTFASYGFLILMNIFLAIKLYGWIRSLNMNGKLVWVFATLVLGLFPVLLFNELTILKKINAA